MTYHHRPDCTAYGSPRWAEVDECGECDMLRREGPPRLDTFDRLLRSFF